MIRVEVKYHAKLSEFGKRLGAPLIEIAQLVLAQVYARTRMGFGPDGPLRPLGYRSDYDQTYRKYFWVKPGPSTPIPPGWLFQVKKGLHAGFYVYRNYAVYAAEHGSARDLYESGAAWESARVRLQTPTRATIAFYGKHRDGKGWAHPGAIMHAALSGEVHNLFALGQIERTQIREIVRERISEDMTEAAALGGRAFKAERRAEALGRRVSRLAGRR